MSESVYVDPKDPQTQLRAMLYDFFYKLVREGLNNAEIFRKLQATSFPPISESDLNALRAKFKIWEQQKPDRMAKIRDRLRVK